MLGVVVVSIVLAWLVCAITMAGIGSVVLRRFGFESRPSGSFWVGVCTAVACLQFYHLFRPVDIYVAGFLCILGLVGAILNRRTLISFLGQDPETGRWTRLCYVAVVLVIAARCAGPAVHYDTGFYGAMAVRWFVTYPLVPGLTNLLGQLGLNSSVFLCVAALDQGPLRGLAFHLFVGLLLCALVVVIMKSFFQAFFALQVQALDWFISLLVVPAIVWALTGEIVGTNTDIPTAIVLIAGMIALFDALQESRSSVGSTKRVESSLFVAAVLFALAVTFKLSSLAVAGLGLGVVFVQIFSQDILPQRKRLVIIASIGFSSVLLIPWLLRGVILSGYPFYPSSAFAFPVDWRVPHSATDFMAHVDESWARIPHANFEETSGIRWWRPWFAGVVRNRVDFLVPVLMSAAGLFAAFWHRRVREGFSFWLLVPSIGGLLFWFLLAPAPRFGEAAIWTTAACLGVVFFQRTLSPRSKKLRRVTLFGLLALGIWCSYPRNIWRLSFEPLLEVHGFLRMPAAQTVPYRLDSGLTVRVPIETNQCWDADLPCSPYFSDSLQLRRHANFRWGFLVKKSDLSPSTDKFTPLHKLLIRAKPTQPVCMNCHLPTN